MRQDKTIGREEKFRLNLWLEKKVEIERHNQLFYRVSNFNLVSYFLTQCKPLPLPPGGGDLLSDIEPVF